MKAFRKYWTILRISLQNAFVYRSNVLGGLVFLIFMFVFFNLWSYLSERGGCRLLACPDGMVSLHDRAYYVWLPYRDILTDERGCKIRKYCLSAKPSISLCLVPVLQRIGRYGIQFINLWPDGCHHGYDHGRPYSGF